jgi:hypothetical protein
MALDAMLHFLAESKLCFVMIPGWHSDVPIQKLDLGKIDPIKFSEAEGKLTH